MHKQLEIASLCVFSTTGIATYVDIFDYVGCKIGCKKNLKIIFLKEQLYTSPLKIHTLQIQAL